MAFKGSLILSRLSRRISSSGRSGADRSLKTGKGQVTVELMLVLPVFMLLLFFIMELGNMAYQTLLVHHCAYELARIGSLVAGPRGGSSSNDSDKGKAEIKMRSALGKMFSNAGQIRLSAKTEFTSLDPQARQHMNEDLVVELVFPAKLVFPGSSYFFADEPKANRTYDIKVQVRMPIEKPMFQ